MTILSGYFIFRNRPTTCFKDDMKNTSLTFFLLFIGFVSFFRQSINILCIILGFPLIVYMFLNNPTEFYSRVGIDPEIVNNLPTFHASKIHTENTCTICTDDILEGQDLLQLRCPGK